MDLHFVSPDLRRLDEIASEVLMGCLFEDERPPQGVTGLVNWRLAGRLDRLLDSGYLSGALGEVMMIPGAPRLQSDKVIIFGLGLRNQFDDTVFDRVANHMLKTLTDLAVRTALIELPGRHVDALPPEVSADRFLELASTQEWSFDSFTLLERPAAHKRIHQHMIEERRRIRRV